MKTSYEHFEERGRRMFRVIYDGMTMETALEKDELSQELLRVFHTRIVSIIKDTGEIPSMKTFLSEPRTAILQGIISEAKRVNKGGSRVPMDSPIHIAFLASQEKVESLLRSFSEKGSEAAIGYVNRLLKESSGQVADFRKQAQEAIRKYQESEKARKKSNLRMSEAIGKFQTNRHMLLERQSVLETEVSWLLLEKNQLDQEIRRIKEGTTGIMQRNGELEKSLEESNTALQRANERIRSIGRELEQGEKAKTALAKIGERLQAAAKHGNSGPTRFHSILSELEELRKQQERFTKQHMSYWRLMEKSVRLEALNETLIRDLETQKRLTKQASFASILDGNFNTDEHVTEGYYYVLEEYFALSLREYGKDFKNHSALEESAMKVREFFFLLRSRWMDPLELGEERLNEVKRSWKNRDDLGKYDLSRTVIEWIYRETIWFLESFIQNKRAIHAYTSTASAYM